jgi:hypothetical protein
MIAILVPQRILRFAMTIRQALDIVVIVTGVWAAFRDGEPALTRGVS